MGRVGRKKHHKGDKPMKEKYRTKRKTKDIDQIHEDLKPENAAKLLNQPADFDLPGNAQFYCLECARYFVSDSALSEHKQSKVHKRRLKCLEDEPYTAEEACRAAGMGSYQPVKKRKLDSDMN